MTKFVCIDFCKIIYNVHDNFVFNTYFDSFLIFKKGTNYKPVLFYKI